ncbi:50S ribosomal protein L9 [Geobacter sulfurreducens]|jgi:large subunit ribosomal protein L9|uniref:Large ribosomal subunit protein bL9 n=1 Tax=Geobacter sulfurreducens (strain ATCC 51573 / DSM 12127 / PCA) TaxID=243231 RepID=RL9_GEOSL|nr:50S ribosomal protein L9 [Geobacter sulfurreducens]Q74FE1.1 RecName: Full=Large ribosomal subunit protein bL9; AltName: Full=50S ribosomal protein L9 [Geobacter sulfurreducens PCA]AAR33998.1 ribosomal protein L9 [Geobacter sulfurreducens PCA]ADI83507.1 ribosomal protein L9 [Geobacter sulfurreducens KN400]AJY70416.1 50S ribosomal protein L9 [Geobacter sulfurreducens]QVW35907.1 50S ribosomal protein L9 [Geobacter sulfurreducens]UAC04732.1 50S ribosomal protein L9 [Geobacter sulfurreducens]
MKVILKENVENLGHIGDIVKVAPGYARNYLIPRNFAIEATEKNAKALEHAKRQLEYKRNKVLEQARLLVAKIEGLSLSISHQAGEEGKLFGSVTNMELAELLKAQGVEIDRKKIVLAEPIKHVGEFTAVVKVHPEVAANLKVVVTKAE